MKQKSEPVKHPAEAILKDIRLATRRQFSAEEIIRIVLEGLRGEESIAELCRRGSIAACATTRRLPQLTTQRARAPVPEARPWSLFI